MGLGESRLTGRNSPRFRCPYEDDCVFCGETTKEGIIQKQHTVQENIPKLTACILNPFVSPASEKFVHEFREEMKTRGVVLNVIPDGDLSTLDTDVFLILVCLHIIRLEADVNKCLRVINSKQYDRTILVILHYDTNKHQDSERILMKSCPEKYANIFRIIDMEFSIDKGIYPCELNTNAFLQLQKIYNNHSKTVPTKTKWKGNKPSDNKAENLSKQQVDQMRTEDDFEIKTDKIYHLETKHTGTQITAEISTTKTDESYDANTFAYKNSQDCLDMSFHYGRGIYPCEMNTKAFRQIEQIYDSHKKTIAMKTKSKGNEPDNDNTETRSNQQLKESHAEVIPEMKKTTKNDDLPEIAETESQLLVDCINFHEFNGIFL